MTTTFATDIINNVKTIKTGPSMLDEQWINYV